MPRRTSRGHRKDRRTNVYVQEERPQGRTAVEEDTLDAEIDSADAPAGSNGQAVGTARARRVRPQRTARQARARSDVFTRTINAELKKIGVLAGGIVGTLVVLTFVLQ